MLRFLRKYSNSVGIKILYGLLAGLFIVWGVGAVGGNRREVVARVEGRDITGRDVDRATALLQRRYEELLKDKFSPDLMRSLDLRGRALDGLVDDALVRNEAGRLGIRVSDAELVEAITHMPEFQENGRFDRERLEAALRYQRDRGEFEDDIRRSLTFQRLQSLVTDGVQVSDGEVEARYRLDHEKLSLACVRIAAAELGKAITPTDEELQKSLADHGERHRVPARVRARYVAYKPADFASQAHPTDQEVAAYYADHRDDRFTEPEQVRARHVLVKVAPGADDEAKAGARKKAEALLARVKAGEDFAALAKKSSDDPGSAPQGGDLGLFARGRMTPTFEDVAFTLEPGQVSEIVETPFGLHIIKVEEHKPGGPKPLDAVHDEIVKGLEAERGLALARKQAEADRRAVVQGKSLAEAAGSRPVQETAPFTAGAIVPGVGRVKGFSETAFALRDGEVSDLIESDDAVYLLAPFERTDAHLPPLGEVRERVVADVRRERGDAEAKARAEKLLARAREVGLDKAAEETGAKVEESEPFDRLAGTIPKLGPVPDLKTDAFGLTPEAPLAPKVYTSAGDAVVAALRTRTPADMAGFASAKDGLHDSLLQQKRQSVLTAYMNFLKERAAAQGALEVRADVSRRGS